MSLADDVCGIDDGWRGICPLCNQAAVNHGDNLSIPWWSDYAYHYDCLHPEVIVVANDRIYVGVLEDLTLGVDAYWLSLKPTVQVHPRGERGWMARVSMPLPNVRRIVKR